MIFVKRVGNLRFEKMTHLGEEPEHPSYCLSVYEPNRYYKHEDDYIMVDEGYYVPKDNPTSHWRLHESCFKNPETSYVISEWVWNDHEHCYEYRWVGDRPKDYYEKNGGKIYKYMVRYGFEQLNPDWYESE